MEKSQVILGLKQYVSAYDDQRNAENQISYLQNRLEQIKSPPKKLSTSKKITSRIFSMVGYGILFAILAFILYHVVAFLCYLGNTKTFILWIMDVNDAVLSRISSNFRSEHKNFVEVFRIVGVPVVLGFITGVIYAECRERRVQKRDRESDLQNIERWEEQRKQIPQLQIEITRGRKNLQYLKKNVQRLAKENHLNSEYQNPQIVRRMIKYLEDGRCDTFKEALNQYEMERREEVRTNAIIAEIEKGNRTQYEKLTQIEAEIARGADAQEQAAKAASDAAFSSSMAWWEAERIRRKL